jgi:hypothetical protein
MWQKMCDVIWLVLMLVFCVVAALIVADWLINF